MKTVRRPIVSVIGGADADKDLYRTARWVGRLLAASGAVVVTGGRGGVMEAACRGAMAHGGLTVGILPGDGPTESEPNPYVQVPIFTGMGDARNAAVVKTGMSVIALGGGFGTLSEIGLALKSGRPVVVLGSWTLEPPSPIEELGNLLATATNPREAVNMAIALATARMPEVEAEPEALPAPTPKPVVEPEENRFTEEVFEDDETLSAVTNGTTIGPTDRPVSPTTPLPKSPSPPASAPRRAPGRSEMASAQDSTQPNLPN